VCVHGSWAVATRNRGPLNTGDCIPTIGHFFRDSAFESSRYLEGKAVELQSVLDPAVPVVDVGGHQATNESQFQLMDPLVRNESRNHPECSEEKSARARREEIAVDSL